MATPKHGVSASNLDSNAGWTEQFDPKYSALYYYNMSSGESSWTKPAGFISTPSPAASASASTSASISDASKGRSTRTVVQKGKGNQRGARAADSDLGVNCVKGAVNEAEDTDDSDDGNDDSAVGRPLLMSPSPHPNSASSSSSSAVSLLSHKRLGLESCGPLWLQILS